MKKILLVITSLLLGQVLKAQQCNCYENPTVDGDFYHTAGRITASFSKIAVPLSHGVEITPTVNTPVVFKIVAAPSILPRCKNTYLISVLDEKEFKQIYTTNSENKLEFEFAFPKCDRAYTVTMQVVTSNKEQGIDPGFLRNQDCTRQMVTIVYPKCKVETTKPLKLLRQF